jgi:hypothetical protein
MAFPETHQWTLRARKWPVQVERSTALRVKRAMPGGFEAALGWVEACAEKMALSCGRLSFWSYLMAWLVPAVVCGCMTNFVPKTESYRHAPGRGSVPYEDSTLQALALVFVEVGALFVPLALLLLPRLLKAVAALARDFEHKTEARLGWVDEEVELEGTLRLETVDGTPGLSWSICLDGGTRVRESGSNVALDSGLRLARGEAALDFTCDPSDEAKVNLELRDLGSGQSLILILSPRAWPTPIPKGLDRFQQRGFCLEASDQAHFLAVLKAIAEAQALDWPAGGLGPDAPLLDADSARTMVWLNNFSRAYGLEAGELLRGLDVTAAEFRAAMEKLGALCSGWWRQRSRLSWLRAAFLLPIGAAVALTGLAVAFDDSGHFDEARLLLIVLCGALQCVLVGMSFSFFKRLGMMRETFIGAVTLSSGGRVQLHRDILTTETSRSHQVRGRYVTRGTGSKRRRRWVDAHTRRVTTTHRDPRFALQALAPPVPIDPGAKDAARALVFRSSFLEKDVGSERAWLVAHLGDAQAKEGTETQPSRGRGWMWMALVFVSVNLLAVSLLAATWLDWETWSAMEEELSLNGLVARGAVSVEEGRRPSLDCRAEGPLDEGRHRRVEAEAFACYGCRHHSSKRRMKRRAKGVKVRFKHFYYDEVKGQKRSAYYSCRKRDAREARRAAESVMRAHTLARLGFGVYLLLSFVPAAIVWRRRRTFFGQIQRRAETEAEPPPAAKPTS